MSHRSSRPRSRPCSCWRGGTSVPRRPVPAALEPRVRCCLCYCGHVIFYKSYNPLDLFFLLCHMETLFVESSRQQACSRQTPRPPLSSVSSWQSQSQLWARHWACTETQSLIRSGWKGRAAWDFWTQLSIPVLEARIPKLRKANLEFGETDWKE